MARINQTSNAKFLDARFAGRKQKRGLYQTGGAISGAALGYTLGGIPGAISGYELGSYLGGKKEKGEDVELKDLAGMGVNAGLNYALGHGLGSLIDYGVGSFRGKPKVKWGTDVYTGTSYNMPERKPLISMQDIVSLKPIYEMGLNQVPGY